MLTELDMTENENVTLSNLKNAEAVHQIYIAGGYLRDTLLGKPIKDIDVFVYGDPWLMERVEKDRAFVKTSVQEYDGDLFHLTGNIKNTRINLLFPKKNWAAHFNSFDLGICKVSYELKRDFLHQHSDFIKDAENKTLTHVGKVQHNEEHVHRIQKKYPDYIYIPF